jgi:hypothetical protein
MVKQELIAASSTTATELPATSATATATGAFFTGLGHVDCQRAPIDGMAIERLGGLLRLFGRPHGYKTETAWAAGRPVRHKVCLGNSAVRCEQILQVIFGGIEGKISHKQFITHMMFYYCPTHCYFPQTVPERRV